MAIDLGELTGTKEVAANDGFARAKVLSAEILALDTDLRGEEDPAIRQEHDLLHANTVRKFLLRGMKRGFKDWLENYVRWKGDLLKAIDEREAAEDIAGTADDIIAEEGEVGGIIDDL